MRQLLFLIILIFTSYTFANTINIVAAENFYGELAKELGGPYVQVSSIISNPNADPHLFGTTTKTSIAISKAQIIIYNGASYDTWMDQILKSQNTMNKEVINVANLIGLNKPNVNPHIWHKPETMPSLAINLTKLFIKIDNSHKAEYQKNLAKFLNENIQVQNKIKSLKSLYNNTQVIATEPVYNYMADAIGLKMEGLDFQWKIMNDTDPSPKMLANYLELLNKHQVKLLFYNNQVISTTTKNILAIANKNNIPIVGISETMQKDMLINTWLIEQLNNTENALKMSKK